MFEFVLTLTLLLASPQDEVVVTEAATATEVRTLDGRRLSLYGLSAARLSSSELEGLSRLVRGRWSVRRVDQWRSFNDFEGPGGMESAWVLEQRGRVLNVEVVRSGYGLAHVTGNAHEHLLDFVHASRAAQIGRRGLWARTDGERPAMRDAIRLVPPDRIAGVALPMHSKEFDYDYSRELFEIEELGAEWVTLLFVTMVPKVDSSWVPRTSDRTPPEDRLEDTIRAARKLGLKVLVLPIVLIENPGPDDWRGTLQPADRALFWGSYETFLLRVCDVASRGGATALSVGSELASLERDELRWKRLIANARCRFAGYLTYSANWDHFATIPFWRQLDFAGMTGYFEIAASAEPTVEELASGWLHAAREVDRLHAVSRLPVVFTEVGMPSLVGAAASPWDYTRRGEVDLDVQRDSFLAFGDVFLPEGRPRTGFGGMTLFDWWGLGGPEDTGYTARGKPAEDVWRELLLTVRGPR